MPILVMCQNASCGEMFDAPDDIAGRKARCPACGTIQVVGQAGAAGEAEAQPARSAQPDAELTLAEDDKEGRRPEKDTASASAPPAPAPVSQSARDVHPEPPADAEQDVFELTPLPAPSPKRQSARPKELPEITTESQRDDEIDLTPADAPSESPRQGRDLSALPTGEPAEAKAAPASEAQNVHFSNLLGDLPDLTEQDIQALSSGESPAEAALQTPIAGWTLLGLGVGGIVAGALIGALNYPADRILATYVGGLAGWTAGFVIAFLIILNAEKLGAGKVRCGACHNVFPEGTEVCHWCGEPLSDSPTGPLASQCLRAGHHALGSWANLVYLLLILTMAAFCWFAAGQIVASGQIALPQEATVAIWALVGLVAFFVGSYWAAALLDVAAHAVLGGQAPPRLPPLSPGILAAGIKMIVIVALYVLPIVTLPLLPVGLLWMTGKSWRGANLKAAAGMAWRQPKDFAITWLMTLLWSAGGVLAMSVLMVVFRVAELLPAAPGGGGVAMRIVLGVMGTVMVGAVVGMFAHAIFRCIGLYGRYVRLASREG